MQSWLALWTRWHPATRWVAGLVAAALMWAQFVQYDLGAHGYCYAGWREPVHGYGWPFVHGVSTLVYFFSSSHPLDGWIVSGIVANWIAAALLVGVAAQSVESWIRSPNPAQFTSRQMFALVAVAVVILSFTIEVPSSLQYDGNYYRHQFAVEYRGALLPWTHLLNPLRWPILFALGCTIYAAGSTVIACVQGAFFRSEEKGPYCPPA